MCTIYYLCHAMELLVCRVYYYLIRCSFTHRMNEVFFVVGYSSQSTVTVHLYCIHAFSSWDFIYLSGAVATLYRHFCETSQIYGERASKRRLPEWIMSKLHASLGKAATNTHISGSSYDAEELQCRLHQLNSRCVLFCWYAYNSFILIVCVAPLHRGYK